MAPPIQQLVCSQQALIPCAPREKKEKEERERRKFIIDHALLTRRPHVVFELDSLLLVNFMNGIFGCHAPTEWSEARRTVPDLVLAFI